MPNALEVARNSGKTVGYIRVSSVDQNTDRQLDGILMDKVFTDRLSGKNTARPQLQACLDYLREDDTLVVHSMDRLARNIIDLRKIVEDLVDRGVDVKFMKENMTFSKRGNSITDKLILSVLGVFAEFERDLNRQRQAEGIAKAQARGVYKGRPHKVKKDVLAELYRMADSGHKKTEIAAALKISRPRVYFYLAQRAAEKEVSNERENQQANAGSSSPSEAG